MAEAAADLCFSRGDQPVSRRGFVRMCAPIRTPEPDQRDPDSIPSKAVTMVVASHAAMIPTPRLIDEESVDNNKNIDEHPQNPMVFVHHQVMTNRPYENPALF